MTTPYTRELDAMSNELIIELDKNKSSRMYPYCLIGYDIHEARKRMTEWSKSKVELLILGIDGCSMDINTCY